MWIIGAEALVNDLPVLAAGTHESSHTLLYHLDYYRCCFLSYNNNNNNNRFTVLCPGLPCHILGNLVIKMIKAFCFPACTSI